MLTVTEEELVELCGEGASTVKENIVRKPTGLRVLHNVLKRCMESINPHWASVVDCGLNPFQLWEENRALPGIKLRPPEREAEINHWAIVRLHITHYRRSVWEHCRGSVWCGVYGLKNL
ncbi:jg16329 [Pararge aegeria aegeria]|uniref:Jg16329 protein n=1 Tax=Pararge aegeria aegeria TaxID=348720 RepID=A0A8S4RTK9_9NEOP|nr:jg16329 [Pararge aegeria aegeria]